MEIVPGVCHCHLSACLYVSTRTYQGILWLLGGCLVGLEVTVKLQKWLFFSKKNDRYAIGVELLKLTVFPSYLSKNRALNVDFQRECTSFTSVKRRQKNLFFMIKALEILIKLIQWKLDHISVL